MEKKRSSAFAISINDIPETALVPAKYLSGGSVGARIAYGKTCSLMHATREPGYHSKPHRHDAEQLNYVLEGEAYIFIGDEVIHAKAGDIVRIPSNVIHWSWVTGETSCSVIEMHTPSLIGDPGVLDTAVSLMSEAEEADGFARVESEYLTEFDPTPYESKVVRGE